MSGRFSGLTEDERCQASNTQKDMEISQAASWKKSFDFSQQMAGAEMLFMDAEKMPEVSCALGGKALKVLGGISSTVSYYDLG